MRVLAITNIYPSLEFPASGVFVEQQVQALSRRMEVEVMFVDRRRHGPLVYYRMGPLLEQKGAQSDLIHVMYGGVMAQQVTAQPGLPPAVVTFHGSDLLGENFSGVSRKWISQYGVRCSRKAAVNAKAVIVVARHLLKALGASVNPGKVRVVPCGIDLERFKPLDPVECRQRLGWQSDGFHVLFASSWGDPVKRPDLARAAVARLDQKRRGVQFHLLSGIPNAEVPIWLNASDVLLLTSAHEGSPTIVKEALACGLPVVSVPVGDVPERIEGINGCHLGEPDAADLANKLDLVYEQRQRLNCREKLEHLSCEATAANLEQLYSEIISERALTQRVPHSREHAPSSLAC